MATYRLSAVESRGTRPVSDLARPPASPRRISTQEAAADHRDQREDEGLDRADAEALQPQQQQGVGAVISTPAQQRNVEQQVEPDGRAEHLGQVAGGDGDFAQHPEREVDGARVGFAAGLRQVAAADDAQPRADSVCSRIAIRFDITSTHSSW